MNQSVYTARNGIIAQQQRLDVIGNNLANVNTNGYKSVRVDFKDALYQDIGDMQPAASGGVERGHGLQVGLTHRSFRQGILENTNNPLDVAFTGDGFFTVLDGDGNIRYTRDGKFSISVEVDAEASQEGEDPVTRQFLVTSEGHYVLDENGSQIELFGNISGMTINSAGELTFDLRGLSEDQVADITANLTAGNADVQLEVQDTVPLTKLGIVDFINPSGLDAVGDNLFAVSDMSGPPEPVEGVSLQQGSLEKSNVDMGQEMTRLIRTQRALQLASRALVTADEMDGKVSQLR